jgi:tetratricopeptide (TPR) repeat protein
MLASITVTSNKASLIGDALRSVVAWVDMCLVIDIGITDDTLDVAREVAGDKLVVSKWNGPVDVGNFADIRNFGLDEAHRLGADMGCILDTDERMNVGNINIRYALTLMEPGIILVPHDSGRYSKERFFSLPALDRFEGGVHECVVPKNGRQTAATGISFSELPKTPEQMKDKLEYMAKVTKEETEKDPGNPRWWYYLGDSLAGMDRDQEALAAFDHCAKLRGWDEESAWACFRMALLLDKMGRSRDAIDICSAGLTRHAGISELPWLAGVMSLKLGMADKAIYWARMAVANGTNDSEAHFIRPRVGFRYPYAAQEGPYELMAQAYDHLGKTAEADKSRAVAQQMKERRDYATR